MHPHPQIHSFSITQIRLAQATTITQLRQAGSSCLSDVRLRTTPKGIQPRDYWFMLGFLLSSNTDKPPTANIYCTFTPTIITRWIWNDWRAGRHSSLLYQVPSFLSILGMQYNKQASTKLTRPTKRVWVTIGSHQNTSEWKRTERVRPSTWVDGFGVQDHYCMLMFLTTRARECPKIDDTIRIPLLLL